MTPAEFLAELAAFALGQVRARSPSGEPRDKGEFWWILGAVILVVVVLAALAQAARAGGAG